MKVLFAVSNEEISESIVKKYQKEYKQIISYKNVYYFNAIVKELQKDKSYDRIVISEDLEAFTNAQIDQIDKFIFEKLDSISDEASNSRGNDTPIILICSDRRTKSEQMLVKLFGIGIYNAILGNDRSVDEVCRLINRPRVKKEAKAYYKIDSEDVNYQAENENDVSEMEIQNILAHYKRLGKDENRYVDSFNNIAAQYNDTQLRIISKFLPLNVRAVLEEKSPKYQQIMSFNNSVSNTLRVKNKEEEKTGPSQILLKTKNREEIMSKPVVIPSAVNMGSSKKLSKPKKNTQDIPSVSTYTPVQDSQIQEKKEEHKINTVPEEKEQTIEQEIEEKVVQPVKRGRGRPKKNATPTQAVGQEEQVSKRGRGRPRKNPVPVIKEEPTILPGFEDEEEQEEENQPNIPQEESVVLPGFDLNEEEQATNEEETFLPGLDDIKPEEEPEEEPQEEAQSTMLPGFEEDFKQDDKETILTNNTIEQPAYKDFKPSPIPQTNSIYSNNQETTNNYNTYQSSINNTNLYEPRQEYNNQYETSIDLSSLLTPDKKIATFVGTSKNGTSFIVNNLAQLISSEGINVALLDTTQNRNSYYIYTKNEEELRRVATNCIDNLANGIATRNKCK